MNQDKRRDFKERTYSFAVACGEFLTGLPDSIQKKVYGEQFLRASGSVGANYLEADNALSKRDAIFRLRICLKEAREAHYWLRLLQPGRRKNLIAEKQALLRENDELVRILATIVWKLKA